MFANLAQDVVAAASCTPSTRGSNTSQDDAAAQLEEREHRRAFLQCFRRWAVLFKRGNAHQGDVDADRWLITEYYRALSHLTAAGFDTLTDELIRRCTFFPSIHECLEIINPPPYTFENPFYRAPHLMRPPSQQALAHHRESRKRLQRLENHTDGA